MGSVYTEEADDDGEAGHDEETDGDVPDEAEHDETGMSQALIFVSVNCLVGTYRL